MFAIGENITIQIKPFVFYLFMKLIGRVYKMIFEVVNETLDFSLSISTIHI